INLPRNHSSYGDTIIRRYGVATPLYGFSEMMLGVYPQADNDPHCDMGIFHHIVLAGMKQDETNQITDIAFGKWRDKLVDSDIQFTYIDHERLLVIRYGVPQRLLPLWAEIKQSVIDFIDEIYRGRGERPPQGGS
ncbi:hypothetical protein OAS86_07125, partial [Gammaproteobacteria bacterium]|nr:hypothetical protein [Gammaproteobacteria bacterium]